MHIDPAAVRSLGRIVESGADELTITVAAVRALPRLSAETPAGPAMEEFSAVCAWACTILAEAATQLASAVGDSARTWCRVDEAVGS